MWQFKAPILESERSKLCPGLASSSWTCPEEPLHLPKPFMQNSEDNLIKSLAQRLVSSSYSTNMFPLINTLRAIFQVVGEYQRCIFKVILLSPQRRCLQGVDLFPTLGTLCDHPDESQLSPGICAWEWVAQLWSSPLADRNGSTTHLVGRVKSSIPAPNLTGNRPRIHLGLQVELSNVDRQVDRGNCHTMGQYS